jgi:hypothetical protein
MGMYQVIHLLFITVVIDFFNIITYSFLDWRIDYVPLARLPDLPILHAKTLSSVSDRNVCLLLKEECCCSCCFSVDREVPEEYQASFSTLYFLS